MHRTVHLFSTERARFAWMAGAHWEIMADGWTYIAQQQVYRKENPPLEYRLVVVEVYIDAQRIAGIEIDALERSGPLTDVLFYALDLARARTNRRVHLPESMEATTQ